MSDEYKMSEPLTNHNTVFSLQQELETTKRQLEEANKLIGELVEDIYTPHRLGLSDKPNEDWSSLSEAKKFLAKPDKGVKE